AMLDDPGVELRREAVDVVLLRKADRLYDLWKRGEDKGTAAAAYRAALAGARETDRGKHAAGRPTEPGGATDLTKHFGFLTHWHVVGPFDNKDGVGYHTVYPPEKGVDLAAAYKGKGGAEVTWKPHTTREALGLVDFNKLVGKLKGVTAYAFAAVE